MPTDDYAAIQRQAASFGSPFFCALGRASAGKRSLAFIDSRKDCAEDCWDVLIDAVEACLAQNRNNADTFEELPVYRSLV